MKRRGFLKFLSLAPVAATAPLPEIKAAEISDPYPEYPLRIGTDWVDARPVVDDPVKLYPARKSVDLIGKASAGDIHEALQNWSDDRYEDDFYLDQNPSIAIAPDLIELQGGWRLSGRALHFCDGVVHQNVNVLGLESERLMIPIHFAGRVLIEELPLEFDVRIADENDETLWHRKWFGGPYTIRPMIRRKLGASREVAVFAKVNHWEWETRAHLGYHTWIPFDIWQKTNDEWFAELEAWNKRNSHPMKG